MPVTLRATIVAAVVTAALATATAEPPPEGPAPPPRTAQQADLARAQHRTDELATRLMHAVATPAPSAIAALLQPPVRYRIEAWGDERCEKTFHDRGVVARPRLAAFAGCLPHALEYCDVLADGEPFPDEQRGRGVCSVRFASARGGRRLIDSIEIEPAPMNGVEGGGEIHAPDGSPPPPPPPPPPAPPAIVPPRILEGSRLAGDPVIVPDATTRAEIARSGKPTGKGTFKLCVASDGHITTVLRLRTTGFEAYDATILNTIRADWRYRPVTVNGKPVAVCTAITFLYSAPPAPPPR